MADNDTSGINKLRKLSRDVSPMPMWVCLRCGDEGDLGGYVNATVREVLNDLADQIERERAEELAAAKRDLADDAREAVERLRRLDGDDVYDPYGNGWKNNWKAIEEAIGADCSCVRTYQEDLNSVRDRIIELIEHGGKRDADVAALRELADELDKRAHGAYGKTFVNASMYAGLMHGLSKRIREAVEGATVPDADREAAADWVEANGGLSIVENRYAENALVKHDVCRMLGLDDVAGAVGHQSIMAELNKRLMPPGTEWPRWEDGKPVSHYDTLEDATAICLALDGSCYSLHCDMPDDERMCLFDGSERVNRPEPEVLGADGEPIKVGETVWDSTSPNDPTSSTVWRHGGPLKVLRRNDVRAGFVICENDQGIPLDCLAADLTHAAPDTQERIDEDASVPPRRYYADKIGHDVGLKDDEEVFTAVALDLLRRQRELDAKKMGGES